MGNSIPTYWFSGRPKKVTSVRTAANIAAVQDNIAQSKRIRWTMIQWNVDFRVLTESDYGKRHFLLCTQSKNYAETVTHWWTFSSQILRSAERFLEATYNGNNILINLTLSDEDHFHFDGFLNTQNWRPWATENSSVIHEKPLHSTPSTSIWCAICSTYVTGPYFIEDEMGTAFIVTGDCYRAMIITSLAPAGVHDDESRMEPLCPTGWRHLLHCKGINGLPQATVPQPTDLPIWWPSLARLVSRFDGSRFLLWGCPKQRVYRTNPGHYRN